MIISVPKNIQRMLKKIERVYKRDIRKGKVYYDSMIVDGKTYRGTDTVKGAQEFFEKFKASLEDGTSEFFHYEEGKEIEAKIRLIKAIWDLCEPFWAEDINYIERDVHIQKGLKKRIETLTLRKNTEKEASILLEFINNAYNSSWGQGDADVKVRYFKLVEDKEELSKILELEDAIEISDSKNLITKFKTLRIVMVRIDEETIRKKKGIQEKYQKLSNDESWNIESVLDMFNLWNDVRETAIYYIYIPRKK